MSPAVLEQAPTPQRGLYKLWPKQLEALRLFGLGPEPDQDPVEEMMYGGEAGGGKSHLARALAVTCGIMWPNSKIAVFRRTYPELYDTHIRAIQQEIPQGVGRYLSSAKELHMHNGSIVMFRHCENEDDVLKYKSDEFDVLIIDESTTFTGYMVSYLRSRVRGTRPDWRPIILYCTNPGDVGHVYFKASFHDPFPAGGKKFIAPADDGSLKRIFLRAKLKDNPALDPVQYSKVLAGIKDPDLRRAVMEGDWTIFKGQYFGVWRVDRHIITPRPIPKHWTVRRLSVDWGFADNWAAHAYVRDEDLFRIDGINRWYAYREWVENEVDEDTQALILRNFLKGELGKYHFYENPIRFVAIGDPSMWNKTKGKPSTAKVYAKYGVFLTKANNDRVQGWRQLYSLLEWQRTIAAGLPPELVWPDGLPSLQFFETCYNMIETLPLLQRDKHKPEDAAQGPHVDDHSCDDARYFAMNVAPSILKTRRDAATQYRIGVEEVLRERRRRHPGTYQIGITRAGR